MSVAQTVRIDIEKFFKGTKTDAEKFAGAFERIFKKSPSTIQTVENFVNEAAPVITLAASLVDPVAEPAVAAALAITETGLAAIQATATAAVSGDSLANNLKNFSATVPQLLSGLEIKNPVLKSAVIRIVNLVVNETVVLIPAVEAWTKTIGAASVPAPAAA